MTASAKPLFQATKRKRRADPRQAALLDPGESRRPQIEARRALDFYPTGEPEAIRSLLARDGARLAALGSVWEPAAGKGDLVREVQAYGLPCIASDLVDHGCPDLELRSFFDWTDAPAPAIITNPPFDLINARDGRGLWLKHTLAMRSWRYCALLLSWDWPAARINGLGELLDNTPFSYCYLMRWKLDFTGDGAPPQRNAWFIWDRDDPRSTSGPIEPGFRWLDRADPRQGEMIA